MWTAAEEGLLRRLRTPEAIQCCLDEEIGYNLEPGGATCYSPRLVMRHRVAHCMEGALFAAVALERIGHEPMLLDLEAVRDDDHVLALFRVDGHWGAIAKSNYAGLRFRTPVYRTLRELALSYFEHYFNPKGEKTLRAWGGPVRLGRRFQKLGWRTSEEDVWAIPEHLVTIPHRALLPPQARGRRFHMDRRLYDAGRLGSAH
jgi:hypothetical protein